MLKSELINKLSSINGDYEVVFPEMEYDGYHSVNRTNVIKALQITEEGRREYPETGTDYIENTIHNQDRKEVYEQEEKTIIVLS